MPVVAGMPAARTLLSTVVMLQLPGFGMWIQFGTVAEVTASAAVIGCVVCRVTVTVEPSATVDPVGAGTALPATCNWVMNVSGAFGDSVSTTILSATPVTVMVWPVAA